MIGIDLKGFKELDRMLSGLPKQVENRVLQRSVTGAMRSVLKAFKAAAPRHLDEQSPASKKYGTLQKNIKVRNKKRGGKGRRGAKITTGDAFWGYMYEKGSVHQPARPWFDPTWRMVVGQVETDLSKRLAEGIEKEAKKLL
jgi:HK97 gp10 family phage protein